MIKRTPEQQLLLEQVADGLARITEPEFEQASTSSRHAWHANHDVRQFDELLSPRIKEHLVATPIGKLSQ